MGRKILLLILLLILGLAACSQPPTPAATGAGELPPEAAPTKPLQKAETPTAEALPGPVEEQPADPTPEPSPTAEPTAAPDPAGLISNFKLANMTYTSVFTADGTAPLSNGKYSEQADPDSAAETIVTILPDAAFGEINGQPVATSVLVTDPGGSGAFHTLHIVGLDEEGEPVELASAYLGDGVEIDSINIAYDQVTAELVTAGPDDPPCCPTQQAVQIYELWGDNLVQTASDVIGDVIEPLPSDLYYRLWTWQRSLDNKNHTVTAIEEPEKYSLIFHEDGTFQYTADCNRGGGQYTADDQGAIRFHPREESHVDCGADSHFEALRATLIEARAYRRGGKSLSLVWGDESVVDQFSDSGPVVPEEAGLAITPDQINFALRDLFESWTAVEVAARPVEPGSPPGSGGLPDHIEIYFDYEDLALRDGRPIMYIIPVDAYIELWELAGDSTIKARVDAVYDFARLAQEPLPTGGLPVLPGEEAGGQNDLAAGIAHTGAGLSSANQTGYRFIGRITEETTPVINQNLHYIYQGFTNDGKYLVTFFSPLNTAELPEFSADLPQEKIDLFNNDVERYLAAETQALNELPPEAWQPNLASLDALINSLEIEGMAAAGLKNTTWAWTGHITNPETNEVITNELQGEYTADYGDFALDFVADCHTASRSYDLISGGMIGEIAAQPVQNYQADCGEDSYARQFIDMLQEVGEFRVLPGGTEMLLAMPDGEADYLMRDFHALPEPAEAKSETVEETGAAAQEEDAGAEEESQTEAAQEYGSAWDLVNSGFSLTLGAAAGSYEWQVAPAVPFAEGPGGMGFPRHILITFDGEDPQEVVQNKGRHMIIFPLQHYKELYEAAGRTIIGDEAARLGELIAAEDKRSEPPQGAMPLLPPAGSAMNRWTQYRPQDFDGGSGVRYLTDAPDRQAVGVWSNETMAYSYQGLTDDGRYYISLWWPVSAAALPETADQAAQEIKAQATDPLTNPAYIQQTAELLNTLNPGDFTPRLSLLDAMVESLTIGE